MLEELKTFITVVEQENFTKAARTINISQPSVSVHIKNLEDYFQTTLLSRSVKAKKLKVTEKGKILYKRAKEILTLLKNTTTEVRGGDEIEGVVSIGTIQTVMEAIVPGFISLFKNKYPDVILQFYCENTQDISTNIMLPKYDIGILIGSLQNSSIKEHGKYNDKIILIVPKDHPLTQENVDSYDFSNENVLLRERGSATRLFMDNFVKQHDIHMNKTMIVANNAAIISTVSNGGGISLMSFLACKNAVENGTVKAIDIGEKYIRSISINTLDEYMLSNASKTFIKELNIYINEKNFFNI